MTPPLPLPKDEESNQMPDMIAEWLRIHHDCNRLTPLDAWLAFAETEFCKEAVELKKNVEYFLDNEPLAVRVREGGGPENLSASLAVTLSILKEKATASRWIKCSERMPSTHVLVLLRLSLGGYTVGFLDVEENFWVTNSFGYLMPDSVTHWQPLDPPPQLENPAASGEKGM